MARFVAKDADNYGGQGGGGYFSLKDDGDTARVRFMYDTVEDIEGMSVHPTKLISKQGKSYTMDVNCLREYNDPIDNCPFCREKKFIAARLYIPVWNEDEGRAQIWQRGKTYFSKMTSLCNRYAANGNFVGIVFEVERHGSVGDTNTTYEMYKISEDDTTLADLDAPQDALGTVVLDKSADDMEFYLENGYFPPDDEEEAAPVRRRGSDNASRETASRGRDAGRGNGRTVPAGGRAQRRTPVREGREAF